MSAVNFSTPERAPQGKSEDDVVPTLASFVSESSIDRTASSTDEAEDPLAEFPREPVRPRTGARLPRAAAIKAPVPREPGVAGYTALAAAIFIAALAGGWWSGLMPGTRPAAAGSIARSAPVRPASPPPAEPAKSTVPVIPSAELHASALSTVARVHGAPPVDAEPIAASAAKPIALAGRAPEQARQPERLNSTPRGTSGGSIAPPPAAVRTAPPPAVEPAANSAPMASANLGVRTPDPGPALPAPAAPPPQPVPDAIRRPDPEALPSVVARNEQSEIQRTLGRYRNAYQSLDAQAARAVWPTVDVRALARAFESLTSQELAFDACQFDIAGEAATAECRGSATYTPKVGSRAPKLEARQWTFHLRKVDEGWKIQSAQTRR